MNRLVTALVVLLALLVIGAAPASAKVHAVSQAGCSGNPNAGATVSGTNSPAGPIPVTASPFTRETFPGQGGDGDGACDVR